MVLKQSFEDFIEKISLDQTRRTKIQSAHNAVREFLAADEEIKKRFLDSYLQGSYRLHTADRPQGDQKFDADVILLLNLKIENGGLLDSKWVIDWIVTRLKTSEKYKDKVQAGKKCVCIDYEDGFHLDIVPAHCPDETKDVILVPPDRKESNPKGYREWCVKRNDNSNKNFYPVVKMLKWWRNIHLGGDASPKSILLTTIIGLQIPKMDGSDDEVLVKTMENIMNFLDANLLVPEVKNPSLESEIISKSWSLQEYLDFKERFKKASEKARKALEEKDEQKTIDLWNSDVLFKGTFPKTVRGLDTEAKSFGEALSTGKLAVSSSGVIGT